ncbi:tripartite tricarboxylate transporter substrate binding protein [Pigmentiphaga sp. H8]|uniref:Bug family tripartite tricarboxylate transporter substrate binding protein n=1 Tax=Pigmentiphaga sp. H8 TaxID=2488560 RepID=UPI000F594FD0|nr:tripartite tricarboxylate transporter substrate binding protein [Pigmentiphaga sp. H8]AZG09443.1 tripartite tricarboxylate transporter substrate binding protein [Pigmentiphaga sp. H8]
MKRIHGMAWAAPLLALSLHAGAAETYPERPVKVIVPFEPGGFTDVVARVVTQQLSSALGQSFIVENKPGAGSTIGTDFVAKAAPDGYTLEIVSTNHVTSHRLYKNLDYDPIKSFTPIAKLADSPYVLFVNTKLPVQSVQELITLSKSNGSHLRYASSGNGSTQHLMGALFLAKSGAKLEHVPYRGSGGAMKDLAAGFVETSFAAVSNGLPHVKSGKIKALGVTSTRRNAQLPDVPSLAEAGVPDYDAVVWLALLGPAGMPRNIVARLNEAVRAGLSKPEAREALAGAGVDVAMSTPEELAQYMAQENRMWGDVIRGLDIRID